MGDELVENVFVPSSVNEKAYYLRWTGEDPRGQVQADFHQDFPRLADDFQLDEAALFPPDKFFSSVLRISSPGVRVWTHYDVMDNIYVQIKGDKDVVMWAPEEALNLYLDGDKSKVIDFKDPDLDLNFPKFSSAKKYVGQVNPADILYIPALWFHNMKALDAGIAINLFWKNLEDDALYDKKDPYGNRDLVPAAKAMRMLDNVWHQLDQLPDTYRDFY